MADPLHPRYYEGVMYLHPEVDWSVAPHERPVMMQNDGAGAYVSKWELAGVPPTNTEIEAALAEKDGTADAEVMRVATFAEDPEVADGLNAVKGGTAADIDAYVEQTITLTATDIDALRLEVQAALRGLARRQLKVLFNPTPLIGQLDAAKQQADIVKARTK
jgi:hypothetical protein